MKNEQDVKKLIQIINVLNKFVDNLVEIEEKYFSEISGELNILSFQLFSITQRIEQDYLIKLKDNKND